jgi:transposase-like protein
VKIVYRRQTMALLPIRAHVVCAFCGSGTWWEKRPELVYRGSHRYARWCCSACGRTAERARTYTENHAATREALMRGPQTPEWARYQRTDTYDARESRT